MKRTIICIAAIAVAMLASACASLNPFAAADGPEEKAYAVLGTYHVFQAQALKIASDRTLPDKVRLAVADADAAAVPILKSLDKALADALDARDALDAGKTSKERVSIVLTNLLEWTQKAQRAVNNLKAAVANAKKVTASTATPIHLELRSV